MEGPLKHRCFTMFADCSCDIIAMSFWSSDLKTQESL